MSRSRRGDAARGAAWRSNRRATAARGPEGLPAASRTCGRRGLPSAPVVSGMVTSQPTYRVRNVTARRVNPPLALPVDDEPNPWQEEVDDQGPARAVAGRLFASETSTSYCSGFAYLGFASDARLLAAFRRRASQSARVGGPFLRQSHPVAPAFPQRSLDYSLLPDGTRRNLGQALLTSRKCLPMVCSSWEPARRAATLNDGGIRSPAGGRVTRGYVGQHTSRAVSVAAADRGRAGSWSSPCRSLVGKVFGAAMGYRTFPALLLLLCIGWAAVHRKRRHEESV